MVVAATQISVKSIGLIDKYVNTSKRSLTPMEWVVTAFSIPRQAKIMYCELLGKIEAQDDIAYRHIGY